MIETALGVCFVTGTGRNRFCSECSRWPALALLALARASAGSADPLAAPYPHALWGNLLLFGAVLCEAAYVVIGKRLSNTLSAKRIAALINLNGFALSTPAGLYLSLQFDFGAVAPQWWIE